MELELQHIFITRPDGGISVMQIVVGGPLMAFSPDVAVAKGFIVSEDGERWEGGITDEGVEAEIARANFVATSWRRGDPAELPEDRTFRNAWRDDGKAVSHDLDAAKDILRSRLREARAEAFAPLDIGISKLQAKALLGTLTDEDKAAATQIEAQRQKLRDAQADPAIDAAESVNDLMALLPA